MTVAEGDNIEFTAVNKGDYIIYFSRDQSVEADTEFIKHPKEGNAKSATKFEIRVDKNVDLVGIDNITFTDPCQITVDKPHIETGGAVRASWIVIRTNSTDTMIKVRWF